MEMREALGELYEIDIQAISDSGEIKLEDLVGESMAVEIETDTGGKRYFQGHCVRFSYEGVLGYETRSENEESEESHLYRAHLRPWLWFLTQTADCRIFQNIGTVDIIKKVFQDLGFSDYKTSLSKTYPERVYCVQYRETDYDFISRLMQEDGIYYYFEHDSGKATLVLCDDEPAHKAVEGHAEIAYSEAEGEFRRDDDHIFFWQLRESAQTGMTTQTDYDFTKPTADLKTEKKIEKGKHSHKSYEIYDYPGPVCGDHGRRPFHPCADGGDRRPPPAGRRNGQCSAVEGRRQVQADGT